MVPFSPCWSYRVLFTSFQCDFIQFLVFFIFTQPITFQSYYFSHDHDYLRIGLATKSSTKLNKSLCPEFLFYSSSIKVCNGLELGKKRYEYPMYLENWHQYRAVVSLPKWISRVYINPNLRRLYFMWSSIHRDREVYNCRKYKTLFLLFTCFQTENGCYFYSDITLLITTLNLVPEKILNPLNKGYFSGKLT